MEASGLLVADAISLRNGMLPHSATKPMVQRLRPAPITPEPALDAPKLEQRTVIEITNRSASCR